MTRALLLANLVGQVVIVVTGGAVRLTGSGLGCSTWPQCEPGSFTPQLHDALSIHPFVEFGNRLVSVLLVLIAIGVAIRIGRDTARRPRFRLLGLAPLAGVVIQSVLGGLSVLTELHPAVVGLHFLLSMVLVSASAALLHLWRAGDGDRRPVVDSRVLNLGRASVVATAVVLVLGMLVTGSGPHSGDERIGYRFALDPWTMAHVHAKAVWVFGALVVALLLATRRGPAPVRGAVRVLAFVTVAQGLVGYAQVFSGLPVLLVGLHLLGASLVALAVTRVWLRLRIP